jgi:hypothetical protein
MTASTTLDPVLRHLLYVLVGAVITMVSLCLGMGPNQALSLLMLSIVCTAGLGLAFWLPLFWGVGWLIATLIRTFRSGDTPLTANETAKQRTLMAYINQSLRANASESQIINRLKVQGWEDAEIEQAFVAVRGEGGEG